MTKSVDAKDSYALIARFSTLYKQATGQPLSINKFKEKWAAADLIDSFGYSRVCLAMDYMFKVSDRNSWAYFARNCGSILNYYDEVERDKESRELARQQAKEWLNESRS